MIGRAIHRDPHSAFGRQIQWQPLDIERQPLPLDIERQPFNIERQLLPPSSRSLSKVVILDFCSEEYVKPFFRFLFFV